MKLQKFIDELQKIIDTNGGGLLYQGGVPIYMIKPSEYCHPNGIVLHYGNPNRFIGMDIHKVVDILNTKYYDEKYKSYEIMIEVGLTNVEVPVASVELGEDNRVIVQ